MPTVRVKTTLTAPSEVNVSLVRADRLRTGNVFRVFFEIFLAITSSLVGVVLSVPNPTVLHFAFLGVVAMAAVAFLALSVWFGRPPKAQ